MRGILKRQLGTGSAISERTDSARYCWGVPALTASIGIWAQGDPTNESVLYRWETDQQTGFVTFEVSTRRFRPADDRGQPIGDLLFDPVAGEPSGTAAGVDRRLFIQVVVAIMRAYRRAGTAPTTAHAFYY
jgi:hypothetical protein